MLVRVDERGNLSRTAGNRAVVRFGAEVAYTAGRQPIREKEPSPCTGPATEG